MYLKLKNSAGFTLIEVLIAMAITGIVAAVIFSMLSGTMLNWQKAEMRMNEKFNEVNLYLLLSAKIENTYLYKPKADYDNYFKGEQESIVFISYYSALFPYFPVTTKIYKNEDENLILIEQPFFWDKPDASLPDEKEMVLAENVKLFQVEYLVYDKTNKDEPLSWVNEFSIAPPQKGTLKGIRFKIQKTNGVNETVSGQIKERDYDKKSKTRF
jgi:prepilin-type N-terminal cleavage/methylation domain-containing protein